MPQGSIQMTGAMAKQLKDLSTNTSTVYVKGSSVRTDTMMRMPSMTGGSESHTFSMVVQCDRQRLTTFYTKSKKYHSYSMDDKSRSSGRSGKSGGSITVSGSITDTGERAKLFGYDARRVKQTLVFTPSANACFKQKTQMEIDGWYADFPGFSCPLKAALPADASGSGDCIDEFDYQVQGSVSGIALKEVKRFTVQGQVITIDEEATDIRRTSLSDDLFQPPAGYKAGDETSANSKNTPAPASPTPPAAAVGYSDSLALPAAGIEKAPLGEKRAGIIRIGIARPKVATPDTKNDPNAGTDIAGAAGKSLVDSLRAEGFETVTLETDSPEPECRAKACDYIVYANVTQKRGGGGMFGKMLAMGAMGAVGGFIPGIGGAIASTAGNVLMGQTMGKSAKAKDEFTFEHKATDISGVVVAQGMTKAKAKQDGEDVLTSQIKQASTVILGEIQKKTAR